MPDLIFALSISLIIMVIVGLFALTALVLVLIEDYAARLIEAILVLWRKIF